MDYAGSSAFTVVMYRKHNFLVGRCRLTPG